MSNGGKSEPMFCALCSAYGMSSPGTIAEGGGFPMCAEHRAKSHESAARKTAQPLVVTWPRDPESLLIDAALSGKMPSLGQQFLGSKGSDAVH